MIVSFVCPSAPTPIGGVTALYEFANGLSRRGHEIHIAHGAFWGRPGVTSIDEIPWFRFEDGVQHHFGEGAIVLPDADVIFGTGAEPHFGLPVLIVQGFDMFPREMEREVFRTPGLKVCIASWLIGVGARYGVPAEQLVHVPYGIDHEAFRLTEPIGERPPQVGMLYNAHPAKGWVVGLQALEEAHRRVQGSRGLVFGTEPPDEPLPDWITFLHAPGPDELREQVYNRCQVFVQPSFYEGFGFTAVEAMACGAALVSTDNGGSADYAVHGETALVCPPGDATALADHLETLLRDADLRVGLATAGQQLVQRFRWDLAAEILEGHLDRYVADPAAFQAPPLDDAETAPELRA